MFLHGRGIYETAWLGSWQNEPKIPSFKFLEGPLFGEQTISKYLIDLNQFPVLLGGA